MQAGILTAEHLITAPMEPLGKLGAVSQAERPMTRSAAQAQAAEAQSSVSTGNADSEPLLHEYGLSEPWMPCGSTLLGASQLAREHLHTIAHGCAQVHSKNKRLFERGTGCLSASRHKEA